MRAVREEKESEKRESAERRSEMGKVREERARRTKAAGAEPFGRLRYQNCTRLWHVRSTSGS